MMGIKMRSAMAMIELIFAIVIIAISLLSIPSMMSIADKSSKGIAIDDDVLARISGWTLEKFQARWDQNYQKVTEQGALMLNPDVGSLNCNKIVGLEHYRTNLDNTLGRPCSTFNPSNIPGKGNGNLRQGIEQLNDGSESITVITATTGEKYDLNATYQVRYISSDIAINGNTATATWRLGSSDNMTPDGTLNTPTHLKRVVTRFVNNDLGVDTTLSFFKSNKGTNDD